MRLRKKRHKHTYGKWFISPGLNGLYQRRVCTECNWIDERSV